MSSELEEPDEQVQALGSKVKQTHIRAIGEFLFLYIKRWTFIGPNATHSKTVVRINEKEDLSGHARQASSGGPLVYSFIGAVIHEGKTPKSGHYTAIVRRGQQYYLVDDDRYASKDSVEALELAGKGCLLLFKRD